MTKEDKRDLVYLANAYIKMFFSGIIMEKWWWLVGGFNPSEKYESQLGLLFPVCGKIKFMFQTTNQVI